MGKCKCNPQSHAVTCTDNPPTSYPFFPKTITIMGHTWTITDMHPAVNKCNVDMQVSGYCGAEEQEIAIIPNQRQSQAIEIMIHEILEALNGMMTLGLEHDQIQLLALGFFQVLYDNGFLNLEERVNVMPPHAYELNDEMGKAEKVFHKSPYAPECSCGHDERGYNKYDAPKLLGP